jgi:hypothetical protein
MDFSREAASIILLCDTWAISRIIAALIRICAPILWPKTCDHHLADVSPSIQQIKQRVLEEGHNGFSGLIAPAFSTSSMDWAWYSMS